MIHDVLQHVAPAEESNTWESWYQGYAHSYGHGYTHGYGHTNGLTYTSWWNAHTRSGTEKPWIFWHMCIQTWNIMLKVHTRNMIYAIKIWNWTQEPTELNIHVFTVWSLLKIITSKRYPSSIALDIWMYLSFPFWNTRDWHRHAHTWLWHTPHARGTKSWLFLGPRVKVEYLSCQNGHCILASSFFQVWIMKYINTYTVILIHP